MKPEEKICHSQRGFSILEFCVCLIILALFVGGTSYFYTRTLERATIQALQGRIEGEMIHRIVREEQEGQVPSDGSLMEGEFYALEQGPPAKDKRSQGEVSKGRSKNKNASASDRSRECPGGGRMVLRQKTEDKEGWWLCVEGSRLKREALEKIMTRIRRPYFIEEGAVRTLGIKMDT